MQTPTTGYLIWRVSLRWRAAADRVLAPLGLTHAQYALLASLYGLSRSGRQPSQRELADYAGLEALYVSKLARAADRAGLVVRTDHPADPRAVQMTLTDHGRDVVVRAIAAIRSLNEELTRPLGDSRHRALDQTLHLLLQQPEQPEQSDQSDRRQNMTSTTSTPPITGRDINLAARATRDVLDVLLTEAGVSFNRWVALRTVALTGPIDAGPLHDNLAADLRVDAAAADDLLADLGRSGLTSRQHGQVALTPAGDVLYRRIQSAVAQATTELYAGIDPGDLAVTARVLRQVTERAAALGGA
jgi:DNA-binding MarR family transcriptional regulator